MHFNQVRAVVKMITHHPQVVPLAIANLSNRLKHNLASEKQAGWSAPPEQITLMITDKCNLRCKMCHYAHSDEPEYQLNQIGFMPPEIFKKLMDEIPGNPYVSFTGGEPLLHPDLADLVAFAKRLGRFCSLTTNGWLLEKRTRELCDSKLDLLVVSVDGLSEVHNTIRGAGSFEHLAAGLEKMLSQPDRPVIFINMSLSNLNYKHMLSMYDQALKWQVDGINYNNLWYQTPEMVSASNSQFALFEADRISWEIQPKEVDPGIIADSLDRIWNRSRFAPIMVNQVPELNRDELSTWYRRPEQFVKYKTTRCAWIRMKVWPDGSIRPCRNWQVGNMSQQDSMQVWNNEQFRAFRNHLAKGILPICARCCYLGHR